MKNTEKSLIKYIEKPQNTAPVKKTDLISKWYVKRLSRIRYLDHSGKRTDVYKIYIKER